MPGSTVIHERYEGSRTEETFLKPSCWSCENREPTLVDFLDVGDWAVLRIVGGIVEFPRLARSEFLFSGPDYPGF